MKPKTPTSPPRFSAREVLERLARRHPSQLMHEDGSVHRDNFAKRTGITAATISRVMNLDDGTWVFRADTAEKLVRAFGISWEQANGYQEIPLAGRVTHVTMYKPTAADLALLERLRSLKAADQADIERLIRLREELAE